MRRVMLPVVLCAALVLSACSGPDPIELPERPDDVPLLDHVAAETQLDILMLSVRQVSDVPLSYEHLYDITDTGAEGLVERYDEWLTAQGWERLGSSAAIDGALGVTWERDGQDIVIALPNLEDTDIAAVLISPERS